MTTPRKTRPSITALQVLRYVISRTPIAVYAGDVHERVGIERNSAQVILRRLENQGYLLGEPETEVARGKTARPPRRYFRLNPDARAEAVALVHSRRLP